MNDMHTDSRDLQIIDANGVEKLLDDLAGRIRPTFDRGTALIGILRRGKP